MTRRTFPRMKTHRRRGRKKSGSFLGRKRTVSNLQVNNSIRITLLFSPFLKLMFFYLLLFVFHRENFRGRIHSGGDGQQGHSAFDTIWWTSENQRQAEGEEALIYEKQKRKKEQGEKALLSLFSVYILTWYDCLSAWLTFSFYLITIFLAHFGQTMCNLCLCIQKAMK